MRRFFCSKQLCIIMFCRISYNLSWKWNLDIDFFKFLTYCNFPNVIVIAKCNFVIEYTTFRRTDRQTLP